MEYILLIGMLPFFIVLLFLWLERHNLNDIVAGIRVPGDEPNIHEYSIFARVSRRLRTLSSAFR